MVSGIHDDLLKAARDTFGKRSELATFLEKRFAEIPKNLPSPEQAQRTLEILSEAGPGYAARLLLYADNA